MNETYQYLFRFQPLDSFSFSGESSVRVQGVSDAFLKNDKHASRRQSFLVETDCMPPQTTIMGAVRRMLLGHAGIGSESFDLTWDGSKNMEDILAVSPVFLVGDDNAFLVPSPRMIEGGDGEPAYIPAVRKRFVPKEGTKAGFLQVKDGAVLDGFIPMDDLFKVYEQAVFHVPGKGRPAAGQGDYYIAQKCRLKNRYSFCAVVTLRKQLTSPLKEMLLPLGSRDSRFCVSVSETSFAFDALKLEPKGTLDGQYCLSLLSHSVLHDGWRETRGLTMAFCQPRPVRSAKTINQETFQLQLVAQKLILAEMGSVFIFESAQARDQFYQALTADPRRICGFNHALCYNM